MIKDRNLFPIIFIIIVLGIRFFFYLDKDKSEYEIVAERYREYSTEMGFDVSDSNIMSDNMSDSIDIHLLWDFIDKSRKIEPYHVYAYSLGIIWRKKRNGDIEWYYLSLDKHKSHVVIGESGGGCRVSDDLFDFFIPIISP